MHRFQRLAVALARTKADSDLLKYAAMIARLGTATEVRLLHVVSEEASEAEVERLHQELRVTAEKSFAGGIPAMAVMIDVRRGPLLDQILTHCADHDVHLLLVGHDRSHPGRRALARRLAMKSPCSVWMVPDHSPAALTRILVPVDFSEPAADSLRVATAMARLAGHGECLALHVYFNDSRLSYEGSDRVLHGQEQEAFQKFVAPIDCQGVHVTPLFEDSVDVARVIQRVAEERRCDLVVLATRGRTRSAAILLGSVTEEVISNVSVPLLVVKHFGAQLGFLRVLLDQGLRGSGMKFD